MAAAAPQPQLTTPNKINSSGVSRGLLLFNLVVGGESWPGEEVV
jgi:hypothetical protein